MVVPDHKLFIIPCGSLDEADFVCGLFNSSVCGYLIRSYAIATGISTHVLERLPIPRYDNASTAHRAVVEASRACRKAVAAEEQVASCEAANDRAVAKALEMTGDDLRTISNALTDLD